MKKLLFLTLFFFLSTVCFGASPLLENVHELQKRKKAGEITEEEFQVLLKAILSGKSEVPEKGRTDLSSSAAGQESHGTSNIPVQVNFIVTKYWRAQDLVNLTTELTLTCNRKKCEGTVLGGAADKVVIAFLADVAPGAANFKAAYRAKVKDPDGKSWKEKTFSFEFSQDISGECEINKVVDFIEVRDSHGGGSVADAKFLNKADYDELLLRRRNKEYKDKNILDNFLRRR